MIRFSRRRLLSSIAVLALVAVAGLSSKPVDASVKRKNNMSNFVSGKNSVTFKSFGVELAGDLFNGIRREADE